VVKNFLLLLAASPLVYLALLRMADWAIEGRAKLSLLNADASAMTAPEVR
jgi:hypothetical protein